MMVEISIYNLPTMSDMNTSLQIKPIIGTIHLIQVGLQEVLKDFENLNLSSDSSSSYTSSTSSKKKRTSGRRRNCVIWSVNDRNIEVLPITTFNKRSLTSDECEPEWKAMSQRLVKHVLAIETTPPIPNKRNIILNKLNNSSKDLFGYLLLRPISIDLEEIKSSPSPFLINQSDLLYINQQMCEMMYEIKAAEILKVTHDLVQLTVNSNDYDDTESQSTSDSLPRVRSFVETVDFDKTFFIEEWLIKNKRISIDARQQIDNPSREANLCETNVVDDLQRIENDSLEQIIEQIISIEQEDPANGSMAQTTTVITTQAIAHGPTENVSNDIHLLQQQRYLHV